MHIVRCCIHSSSPHAPARSFHLQTLFSAHIESQFKRWRRPSTCLPTQRTGILAFEHLSCISTMFLHLLFIHSIAVCLVPSSARPGLKVQHRPQLHESHSRATDAMLTHSRLLSKNNIFALLQAGAVRVGKSSAMKRRYMKILYAIRGAVN